MKNIKYVMTYRGQQMEVLHTEVMQTAYTWAGRFLQAERGSAYLQGITYVGNDLKEIEDEFVKAVDKDIESEGLMSVPAMDAPITPSIQYLEVIYGPQFKPDSRPTGVRYNDRDVFIGLLKYDAYKFKQEYDNGREDTALERLVEELGSREILKFKQ